MWYPSMTPFAFSGSAQPKRIECDVTSNTVTFSGLVGTANKQKIKLVKEEKKEIQRKAKVSKKTTWFFSCGILNSGRRYILLSTGKSN